MSYVLNVETPVAVIGAGSMGAGIAQLAAQAGHTVHLYDAQEGAAASAVERIAADLAGAVRKERMTAVARDAVLARLHIAPSVDALGSCGLVVEAIVERLDIKQNVFRQLEAVLPPNAVLATNTSSISITAIAHGLQQPQRVVGLHFFNPATRMKLVEVITGVQTDAALVAAMHALARSWGKTSVDAPNTPGFIVNRAARPYYAEGLRLLAERVAPVQTIDKLLREAGRFALGPFELMDLIGLDVNLSVTTSVFQATAYDTRYAPHVIQEELVRSGRFGRKSGHGFYNYSAEVPALPVESVAPAAEVKSLRAAANMGLLGPLVARLQAAGMAITVDPQLPDEILALGDTWVALSDGRTAAERAYAAGHTAGRRAWLLLDLALDYAHTTTVAATGNAAAQGDMPQLAAVLGAANIDLLPLADVAGLVVMRIVCGLANEAADLVAWAGARPADIDTAMKLGTSYPQGPLAWADALGPSRVVQVLAHLHRHYGEARYRCSPYLSRAHFEGVALHV